MGANRHIHIPLVVYDNTKAGEQTIETSKLQNSRFRYFFQTKHAYL